MLQISVFNNYYSLRPREARPAVWAYINDLYAPHPQLAIDNIHQTLYFRYSDTIYIS